MHRENIHSILLHSNATPIRGHWGIGYTCSFCSAQYSKPADLKTHTLTHPDIANRYVVKDIRTHIVKLDVTDLRCQICHTEIDNLENLMRHLKIHDKPMNVDINNHLVPFKFDNDELKCVKCGKEFSNFKNIAEHMNDAHFRNYECDKCNRGFVNRSTLATHSIRHRLGSFACEYCAKIFSTKIKRTEHERVLHLQNSKTRKCRYCDAKFVDVVSKINHEVKIHGMDRPEFKCKACDAVFASPQNLQSHVKNVHLVHRPYKCEEDGCESAFFVKKDLVAHIFTHGNDRPFSCNQCFKTYKSKKSLHAHKHLHNETREFKCRMCNKRFKKKNNLKTHLENIHDIV